MRYRSPFRYAERTYWNIRSRGLLPERYLEGGRGVIHVGANKGQERFEYARYGLKVAWVEPIPSIFAELQSNLADFPDQTAYNCLIAGEDGIKYEFRISDNEGSSSSILEPNRELTKSWEKVTYSKAIDLEGISLPSFVRANGIDLASFDILVLDTEGSELLILKGASEILSRFRYIKCEAANFEVYAGSSPLSDMDAYMSKQGFKQTGRFVLSRPEGGGRVFDVLYQHA